MKIILFDLGDTLESSDILLPGALDMLLAVQAMRDSNNEAPVIALVSNYYDADSPAQVEVYRKQYYDLLETLDIKRFFEPLPERVTLSTEVGNIVKPDERIFRAAIDKIHPGLAFHHVIFITENQEHIAAARELGMTAIQVQEPGQEDAGEVKRLSDLVPIIERLLAFSPCGKKLSEAVGFTISQSNKSKQLDPDIKALAAKVDEKRLREIISRLTKFGTRWSYSPGIADVPDWVHKQFVALGYPADTQTRYQQFELPGSQPQRNVLCGSDGSGKGIILICCHYDSLSENPSVNAPGADDNASGVAATLELARILRDVQLKREVLFAVFGGEEQGLYGSAACAEIAAQEKWLIDVVINLDMVSYKQPGGPPGIIVEYDQGNKHPGNDAAAKAYALTMAQAASDYTSLEVSHTDIWSSDYLPFEAKGFACIGAYNATDNPFYHKTTDTLARIDIPHLKEVVKMVLATVLILAR